MDFTYSRSQGMREAKSFLNQATASEKFPHALLVHGPEGVGQNALLLDLVDILLCNAGDRRPCGTCPGCLGRQRKNLDNLTFLIPLEKKDKADSGGSEGEMEGSQLDELVGKVEDLHADPYGFTRSEKSNLNISQVRSLQSRLAYAESSRLPRIVLILWAETMAAPAANTLLKTLEEPPANTYFLISSEDRSVLLPTIISRCTQLAVFSMAPADLLKTLVAKGKDWGMEPPPERLIPFAEGSPGVLLGLHRNGGDTLLEEAGLFHSSALRGDWLEFSEYVETSESFVDMQSAARILHFLLRTVRLFHSLVALAGPVSFGPAPGAAAGQAENSWTREALQQQGFSPTLASILGPLEWASDLKAYVNLIEDILVAVQAYAKPKVAALGLYLEFSSKNPRLERKP